MNLKLLKCFSYLMIIQFPTLKLNEPFVAEPPEQIRFMPLSVSGNDYDFSPPNPLHSIASSTSK